MIFTAAEDTINRLRTYVLTDQERQYALSLARRLIGYGAAWLSVDEPGVRKLAMIAGISAALWGLENVSNAEDPPAALTALLAELPGEVAGASECTSLASMR